jgi:hypothetical protein
MWCHIPEDGFLHSHRRENIKSYEDSVRISFQISVEEQQRALQTSCDPNGSVPGFIPFIAI